MENKEVFNEIVESACEFTERSIRQFGESPKNSIINFYTGLELFLKSRLIAEHWALIFSRPEYADKAKFEAGDFASANFAGLVTRLEKIANKKIPIEAQNTFNALRQHRNKLVHFHHNAFTSGQPEQILSILKEQGKAWWHLRSLLTDHWANIFEDWQYRIGGLDWLIHQDNEFLNAKWELIEPLVREKERDGIDFVTCSECGKSSAELTTEESYNYDSIVFVDCLVCHHRDMKLECPSCDEIISFFDGEVTCSACKEKIDLFHVVRRFVPPYDQDDGEQQIAWCGYCEAAIKSIIPFRDSWICLSCFARFNREEVEYCQYCGEKNAGVDLSCSASHGCLGCEGPSY